MINGDLIGLAFIGGLLFGVVMVYFVTKPTSRTIDEMIRSTTHRPLPPPSRPAPPMPKVKPSCLGEPIIADLEHSLARIEMLLGALTEEQARAYVERGRLTVNDFRRGRNEGMFRQEQSNPIPMPEPGRMGVPPPPEPPPTRIVRYP